MRTNYVWVRVCVNECVWSWCMTVCGVCKPKTRVVRLMAAVFGRYLVLFVYCYISIGELLQVYFPIFMSPPEHGRRRAAVATAIGAARRCKQNERVYTDAHRHASKQNSKRAKRCREMREKNGKAEEQQHNAEESKCRIKYLHSLNRKQRITTIDGSDGWMGQDEVVSVSCMHVHVYLRVCVRLFVSPAYGIPKFIMYFGWSCQTTTTTTARNEQKFVCK